MLSLLRLRFVYLTARKGKCNYTIMLISLLHVLRAVPVLLERDHPVLLLSYSLLYLFQHFMHETCFLLVLLLRHHLLQVLLLVL